MDNRKLLTMDSSEIYRKFLDKTLHFLSFRPRSEKEVRDNLAKKKAPLEIVDQIITRLKEQRFLNDEEFTRWWIEQRSRFRPKGMRIIKLELRQKGISSEIIEGVISSTESEQSSAENDLDMAKKIVEKKIAKYERFEKREIYQKLGAHLAGKGFDWDTIKQAIDAYLKKE